MENYKYYTPIKLAECLIKIVPHRDYKNIIDICCGSWNLLKAAKSLYPKANYTGVDVDAYSSEHRLKYAKFYNSDGRIFALSQIEKQTSYDLILSNPPFGYLKDEDRVFLNYDFTYKGLINKRYENEMTQANLILAHEESVLVFILPNTFVEGESNKKARVSIAKDYHIYAIICLPDDTFGKAKISTYAIIMIKRSKGLGHTKLYNAIFKSEWSLEYKSDISIEDINNGFWIGSKKTTKSDINLFRGSISSSHFEEKGLRVLHCSNTVKNNKWIPSLRYCSRASGKNARVAKKGDILINRVGKYAGYWTINNFDNIRISDCIIVLKTEDQYYLQELSKNSIGCRVKIPLRGVSTKYIAATDIHALFEKTNVV